jgi:hypothetical protein
LHIGTVTTDPHAALRDRVLQRVLTGPGDSDPAVRTAAAEGRASSPELQALIDKIQQHAYKVTDDDIARLASTHDDDALFEIIVSAALGASRTRLMAGLRALDDA